jgi:hypothetical protein
MTNMERDFIGYANELGYFPDAKQAREIWDEWSRYMAQRKIHGRVSDELYNDSMKSSIEKVMNRPAVAKPKKARDK